MQTRLRRSDGSVETLHTLNGTATAIGRTLIAIMENHSQADGSVIIPGICGNGSCRSGRGC
jgi:seryl-tRNA synthetase